MKKEKVLIWLSGGVDSAVAAALLLQQGYEVVGGFMKNYTSDTGTCTTYKDAEEAIKVAKHLGIELMSFDLQKEYQERIIDYIFSEYQKGVTPNPDVLCNSLIKFDVFLKKALELWFDKIATGHYARIRQVQDASSPSPRRQLRQGIDKRKDQSYFLSGLDQFQLSKSLFPLGELTKPQVREKAKEIWLPNAERKDSQGLCFIGNVPIRQFLMQRFPIKTWDILYTPGENLPTPSSTPGEWKPYEATAAKVGTHQGAYFYTIGQKQGLGLNFKAYVYRIDIENNILYVTDKDSSALKTHGLIAKDWHWIDPQSAKQFPASEPENRTSGKIRYRQIPAVTCQLSPLENGNMHVIFDQEQRAVAPGQVFVAYQGEICLGSGIIA